MKQSHKQNTSIQCSSKKIKLKTLTNKQNYTIMNLKYHRWQFETHRLNLGLVGQFFFFWVCTFIRVYPFLYFFVCFRTFLYIIIRFCMFSSIFYVIIHFSMLSCAFVRKRTKCTKPYENKWKRVKTNEKENVKNIWKRMKTDANLRKRPKTYEKGRKRIRVSENSKKRIKMNENRWKRSKMAENV